MLMNDPNTLSKDVVPYQLNQMLHSNQGLLLFRQTQTLSRQKKRNFSDISLILGCIL